MPKHEPRDGGEGSERKANVSSRFTLPSNRVFIDLTDEQVNALAQAQAVVTEAQGRLNALLLGIMTGAHISAGTALRITDSHPRQLEIEPSRNGNG